MIHVKWVAKQKVLSNQPYSKHKTLGVVAYGPIGTH